MASVPANATVGNGVNSVAFSIRTYNVTVPTQVTITAKSGTSSATAQIIVGPIGIESLTLNPTSVPGGSPSTGTVTLGGPAGPGGVTVTLAVDNTKAASVGWSLTIPQGQSTGTFTVTTYPVSVNTPVVVRAASPGPTQYATLTVTSSLALAGLSVTPTTVKGGSIATATASLTLPAPSDIVVMLSSSDPVGDGAHLGDHQEGSEIGRIHSPNGSRQSPESGDVNGKLCRRPSNDEADRQPLGRASVLREQGGMPQTMPPCFLECGRRAHKGERNRGAWTSTQWRAGPCPLSPARRDRRIDANHPSTSRRHDV